MNVAKEMSKRTSLENSFKKSLQFCAMLKRFGNPYFEFMYDNYGLWRLLNESILTNIRICVLLHYKPWS
jgi:hypothetical protein